MNNLMALLRSTDTSAQTWYPTREPLPIHSPIKNQQATCRNKTNSVQYPSHSLQLSDLSDNHCVDGNLGHACLSPFKSQCVSHQSGGPFHNLNIFKYSEIFWNTLVVPSYLAELPRRWWSQLNFCVSGEGFQAGLRKSQEAPWSFSNKIQSHGLSEEKRRFWLVIWSGNLVSRSSISIVSNGDGVRLSSSTFLSSDWIGYIKFTFHLRFPAEKWNKIGLEMLFSRWSKIWDPWQHRQREQQQCWSWSCTGLAGPAGCSALLPLFGMSSFSPTWPSHRATNWLRTQIFS